MRSNCWNITEENERPDHGLTFWPLYYLFDSVSHFTHSILIFLCPILPGLMVLRKKKLVAKTTAQLAKRGHYGSHSKQKRKQFFFTGITKSDHKLSKTYFNYQNICFGWVMRMFFYICFVWSVQHPDIFWAYLFREVKDWIV